MLQHNLGLAYFDCTEGDRQQNLKRSIECFNSSLAIYTNNEFSQKWKINQYDLKESRKNLRRSIECFNSSLAIYTNNEFSQKWKINQYDLKESRKSLLFYEQKLIGNILGRINSWLELIENMLGRINSWLKLFLVDDDLSAANLSGANLSGADFFGINLSGANLTGANLSGANLTGANLSGANLTGDNLSGANLTGANVREARFEFAYGIPELLKQELIARGAIFDDAPGDRSESRNLVPR
jgi:uncharacterized protein YjbI with pentapeptide repeats